VAFLLVNSERVMGMFQNVLVVHEMPKRVLKKALKLMGRSTIRNQNHTKHQ
jgi:hypothetical protein